MPDKETTIRSKIEKECNVLDVGSCPSARKAFVDPNACHVMPVVEGPAHAKYVCVCVCVCVCVHERP